MRCVQLQDADQIAVVSGGRISEIGPHGELMQRGEAGHYYQLVQRQLEAADQEQE